MVKFLVKKRTACADTLGQSGEVWRLKVGWFVGMVMTC